MDDWQWALSSFVWYKHFQDEMPASESLVGGCDVSLFIALLDMNKISYGHVYGLFWEESIMMMEICLINTLSFIF